jgi:hypothetical protein
LIRDFEVVNVEAANEGGDKELSDAAIVGLSRKMIAESCWEGKSESKLSVVKCLASFLSVGSVTKKRKI